MLPPKCRLFLLSTIAVSSFAASVCYAKVAAAAEEPLRQKLKKQGYLSICESEWESLPPQYKKDCDDYRDKLACFGGVLALCVICGVAILFLVGDLVGQCRKKDRIRGGAYRLDSSSAITLVTDTTPIRFYSADGSGALTQEGSYQKL